MLLNLIRHHSEDTLAYNRSQVGMTSVLLTLLPYLFFSSPVFSSPLFCLPLFLHIPGGVTLNPCLGMNPWLGSPFSAWERTGLDGSEVSCRESLAQPKVS